ncbi:MAG: tripartite tricarboxylate transporter substrate-binding protein, partial [Roseococcus sp.]
MFHRAMLMAVLAVLALLPNGAVRAQAPVTIVTAFGAGSAADIVARLLAVEFAPTLGVPVVVNNITGAAGTIAANQVVRARPDGLTLLFTPIGPIAIQPNFMRNAGYVAADLVPICMVNRAPLIMMTPQNSGLRTLADVVASARAGNFPYGTTGVGTTPHLSMVMFARVAGVEVSTVILLVDRFVGGRKMRRQMRAGGGMPGMPGMPGIGAAKRAKAKQKAQVKQGKGAKRSGNPAKRASQDTAPAGGSGLPGLPGATAIGCRAADDLRGVARAVDLVGRVHALRRKREKQRLSDARPRLLEHRRDQLLGGPRVRRGLEDHALAGLEVPRDRRRRRGDVRHVRLLRLVQRRGDTDDHRVRGREDRLVRRGLQAPLEYVRPERLARDVLDVALAPGELVHLARVEVVAGHAEAGPRELDHQRQAHVADPDDDDVDVLALDLLVPIHRCVCPVGRARGLAARVRRTSARRAGRLPARTRADSTF